MTARNHLIDVLSRSHARACQITEEILCLLQGGFADGAMARWRTLHEVAVVASFIAAHGEELAERYVLHEVVEAKRAAAEYQKCQQRLAGYDPIEERELKALQASYDDAIARFGKEFKGQYGWAAHQLKIAKPNFDDIERAVGIGHFVRITVWLVITCTPIQRVSFSNSEFSVSNAYFFRVRAMPDSLILVTVLRGHWRTFPPQSLCWSPLSTIAWFLTS